MKRHGWMNSVIDGSVIIILLGFLAVGAIITGSVSSTAPTDTLTANQSAYPPPKMLIQKIDKSQPTPTDSTPTNSITLNEGYPSPPSPIKIELPTATTRHPEDPAGMRIVGVRVPNTFASVQEAGIVVIGRVKQVLPARWTTPDGRRPANPHVLNNQHVIFRPAVIEIEEYLNDQQPMGQLRVFAWGGSIGKDSFEAVSDDLYTLQENTRVVLFLKPHAAAAHEPAFNGQPFFDIMEKYTITSNNQAQNTHRVVPVDQLRKEVVDAVNQLKTSQK